MRRCLYVVCLLSACGQVPRPASPRAPQPRVVLVSPPVVPMDHRIAQAVERSLAGDPQVDLARTDVQVNDGIVELGGVVPSPDVRDAMIMRIERVRGVRSVIDRFQPMERPRADEEVARDVQTALEIDTMTEALAISVQVEDGVVALGGTVASFGQRRTVERIARAIAGVTRVESRLEVDAPPRAAAQIAGDVRTALRNDRWIDPWLIEVVVRGDVVELSGTQPTAAAKRRAIAVSCVPGVRDVDASELRVDPELRDEDRVPPRRFVPPATQEIRAAVRLALDRDAGIADPIDVQLEGGILTLRGEVSSIAARAAAEDAVREIRGIDRILNWIVVDRDPVHTNFRMRQAALRAVALHPEVDASRITVAIDHGAVVLRGELDSARARRAAERACQRISGVLRVQNEIVVPEGSDERAPDRVVEDEIVRRLEWSPYADDRRVQVEVVDGEALLRGDVDDRRARDEAVRLAREAGARRVIDGTALAMR